jgi:hypothetical protein
MSPQETLKPTEEQRAARDTDHKIINFISYTLVLATIGVVAYERIKNGEVNDMLANKALATTAIAAATFYLGHTGVDLYHFNQWRSGDED